MIPFILKSTFSLLILFLFHKLFLEKENIPHFKRYYLLMAVVFSVIMPLIQLPAAWWFSNASMTAGIDYQKGYYSIKQMTGEAVKTLSFNQIIFIIYFIITGMLLLRFIVNLFKMIHYFKTAHQIRHHHLKLYLTDCQVLPFTFFRRIYVNALDYKNGIITEELVLHEMTHARQRHSLDIVFIEIMQIILWFNPVIYFYKSAIRLNHEYLADAAVLHSHSNIHVYKNQLVHLTFRKSSTYLASCFHFSLTKKRLLMMTKQVSFKIEALKKASAILLFLATGILVIFAQDPPPPPPPAQPVTGQSVTPPPPPPPPVSSVSDQSVMPPPPPPPPPPMAQNLSSDGNWWMEILDKHKIRLLAYNNFDNIFEMGEKNSIDHQIVTLEKAWIIINMDNSYTVIESPLIYHDLEKNTISGNEAHVKVYSKEKSEMTPVSSFYWKDFVMEVEKNGAPPDRANLKAKSIISSN